jgi:hypothetical protein
MDDFSDPDAFTRTHHETDVIEKIKDFYFRRGTVQCDIQKPLIPTKAALFALDHRLVEIDEQINMKKQK